MYLIFVMVIYFTISDVQLIKGIFCKMRQKRKLPELQQPKEAESDET